MSGTPQLCHSLKKQYEPIAERCTEKIFAAFPDVEQKYGPEGVEHTREDIRFHLDYLHSAICMGSKDIFLGYIAWVKIFFTSIRLHETYIVPPFKMIREAIFEVMEEEAAAAINEYIDYALDRFAELPDEQSSFIQGDHARNVLAHQYIQALLRKDRKAAEQLILDSLEKGTEIRDLYLSVFQPVQWEVGRLWQHNEISVAMEHYMTAATQFIMSGLYPKIFRTERIGRKMIATSVSGELHELGIRMVSDFFELEGWDTYYLGASTPPSGIVDMIRETNADLLAISATIPFNLQKVEGLIQAIQTSDPAVEIKILVGGRPFNTEPELWKKVGADGHARDAEAAVREARRLIGMN